MLSFTNVARLTDVEFYTSDKVGRCRVLHTAGWQVLNFFNVAQLYYFHLYNVLPFYQYNVLFFFVSKH